MTEIRQSAPVLETPRLILRGWQDEDIEPWVAMSADPRVAEFFLKPSNRKRAEARFFEMRNYLQQHGYGWWAIEIKDGRKFAGRVSLHPVPFKAHFTPATEVGWRLAFEEWGKGYATEGASAALKFGFETMGCDEIVARTSCLNIRSQRVMQRLRMTYNPVDDFDAPNIEEGHPLRPQVLYRLRQSEYASHTN